MKKAFTLIEVNLAVGVMTVGVLSILGLYMFGYRETAQSREDIEAAALADHVIAPLVAAITHTNMSWETFRDGYQYPSDEGWGAYFNSEGVVVDDPDSKAQGAFESLMKKLNVSGLKPAVDSSFPLGGRSDGGSGRALSCGLVIQHDEGSSVVRISFRATPKPSLLMSMPLFYTEARFQGDPNNDSKSGGR